MVTAGDLCRHILTPDDLKIIFTNAQKASIGGMSNIRSAEDRWSHMSDDQVAGQIGNYVGSILITGSTDAYHKAREIANANPTRGDDGEDLPGYETDCKCSFMRYGFRVFKYNCIVAPREKHPNWKYAQFLIQAAGVKDIIGKTKVGVYGCGWAMTDDLPREVSDHPGFAGKYGIPIDNLRPFSTFPSLQQAA